MKFYTFYIFIVVVLFAKPLNAQIKTGDTLVMPDSRVMKDTTLEFRFKHTKKNRKTVGLVLSGGGAKGLAHIGVLKVLEREGIPIDYIGGTSMGGLIGGLYASGYDSKQLNEISHELPWLKLLSDEKERTDLPIQEKQNFDQYILSLPMVGYKPGLPKGLKEGQLIVNVLNKLTWKVNDIHNFENLPTPFFCVATDLETGDALLIDDGDLPMALRSTMSIPSIFAPVKYNGHTVIDGGIVNNFPVDVMLDKGVDYIIGVDVGAALYKSDEISSVLDILDQISSYHQIKTYKSNVKLTDIYIKPDITGLSALSFDDVTDVIKRGEDAAMAHITEIRRLAKSLGVVSDKVRKFKLTTSDTIFISKLKVNGLKKVGLKMVVGRLGINLPGVNSISELNDAIDRLYSSNFFQFINYKLIKDNDGYILDIDVTESSNNLFNVGAKYDTDLGASLALNVELVNKVFPGSRLDINLKVGPNPAGGIRYLIDRGQNIGFGANIHYNSNSVKLYSEDYNSIDGSYFMSFSSFDLFLYSNYSNYSAFIVGASLEYLNVSTEVSPIPISIKGIPFFNVFAKYIMDSYDNKYYPTKGSMLSITPTFVSEVNSPSVFFVNTNVSTVINLNNKFALLPSAFLGASWGGLLNTGYFYMLGGNGYNDFYNMKGFVGMPITASYSNNLLYGRVDLRYQILPKHYIVLKANAALESDLFEKLFFESRFSYGGGIAYSLNSLVGPIELGLNVSNRLFTPKLFINIGFYF